MLRVSRHELIANGQLLHHLGISTARAAVGLLIGGGLGLLVGLLTGLSPLADRFLDTSVQMGRHDPHLALIPLVILWFAYRRTGKAVSHCAGCLLSDLPQHLSRHSLDRSWPDRNGACLRSADDRLFAQLILPGPLPSILVGLRLALGDHVADADRGRNDILASRPGIYGHERPRVMQTDIVLLSILIMCPARQAFRLGRLVARSVARALAAAPKLATIRANTKPQDDVALGGALATNSHDDKPQVIPPKRSVPGRGADPRVPPAST